MLVGQALSWLHHLPSPHAVSRQILIVATHSPRWPVISLAPSDRIRYVPRTRTDFTALVSESVLTLRRRKRQVQRSEREREKHVCTSHHTSTSGSQNVWWQGWVFPLGTPAASLGFLSMVSAVSWSSRTELGMGWGWHFLESWCHRDTF